MVLVPAVSTSRIHLPASLRSTGVTRLRRYYGRSDSCPAALRVFSTMNTGCPGQVSPLSSRIFRTFRLQTPLTFPIAMFGFKALGLHRVIRRARSPAATPLARSLSSLGLRHLTAGSPRSQAESSSLVLRTDRSPRVALHLASRRRSYLRLRKAKPPSDGDLHPAGS